MNVLCEEEREGLGKDVLWREGRVGLGNDVLNEEEMGYMWKPEGSRLERIFIYRTLGVRCDLHKRRQKGKVHRMMSIPTTHIPDCI